MNRSLIQHPIAIVGMACRLPGADNLEQFWELLQSGKDAITRFPPDRLDRSLYFDPEKGVRGKSYTDLGGLITERPLDPALLPMSPEEQKAWDACHLIFAEVAANAWSQVPSLHRRASESTSSSKKVGVYLGHSGGSREAGDIVYATLAEQTASLLADAPQLAIFDETARHALIADLVTRMRLGKTIRRPGGQPNLEASAAGRLVAQLLGLQGPEVVLDAACASSLVALGLAALAVQQGELDAAVVGGASYNKCDSLVLFSNAQSCSATGTRPFDEHADGLISSEGYIALVIKRLDHALRDGDSICAVLRGMGWASDGRGKSLWAPRREGQLEAVRRAYGSNISPERVQYVEAHATSTQVGDATEVQALADFFGPVSQARKLPIGSVKSNIGHTLETAGLAGLVKSILAMQKETIPPTANLKQLSSSIPWHELPFIIPTTNTPWPETAPSQPRCAAVNAFGIGGLNVHVVVEQFLPIYHEQWRHPLPFDQDTNIATVNLASETQPESIAIIGRGFILPGANEPQQLNQLLQNKVSQITDASPHRWLNRIGIDQDSTDPNMPYLPWQVSTGKGGYLLDYAYDWRKHKVPPKQVERANPLQFMFLDAAGKAIEEATAHHADLMPKHTCVVVGTIFGGEFGHQLQLGLRLVELRRDILATLDRFGLRGDQAEQILAHFEKRLFDVNPALLDETGSFTSSTLASRITKQYNLLGGALAIDAGDSSALAALHAASSLLRSGSVDTVVCACGQRAMDLPSYENQASRGWLAEGAKPPRLPGEGVVVFVLKRMSDAQRDQNQVFASIDSLQASATLDDLRKLVNNHLDQANQGASAAQHPFRLRRIQTGFVDGVVSADEIAALQAIAPDALVETSETVGLIGHLMGAQGAVSLVANTCDPSRHGQECLLYANRHGSTYLLQYTLHPAPVTLHPEQELSRPLNTLPQETTAPMVTHSASTKTVETISPSHLPTWIHQRLEGKDWNAVRQRAHDLLNQLDAGMNLPSPATEDLWPTGEEWRTTIVARDNDELAMKLRATRDCDTPTKRTALCRMGVWATDASMRSPKAIAVLFPGQGSQHTKMLEPWSRQSEGVRRLLEQVEQSLVRLDSPPLASLLDPANTSGSWPVQASMFIGDAACWTYLQEQGVEPAIVAGHSLGEFAALIASQAWDVPTALSVLRERAKAVDKAQSLSTGLISIPAGLTQVRQWLADYPSPIYVTHHNAPGQTVVGGPLQELQTFIEWLGVRNVTASVLRVPAAFHTPLMAAAQIHLAKPIRSANLSPARSLMMSSVNNRYVADPREMRRLLLDQLTTPVFYVEMIRQLYSDGARIFLECGPGQVLTRLHQSILADDAALCWAMDRADQDVTRTTEELRGLVEQLSSRSKLASTPMLVSTTITQTSEQPSALPSFDATHRRRHRRRHEAAESSGRIDDVASIEPLEPIASAVPSPLPVELNRELLEQSIVEEESSTPVAASTAKADGLETFLRDFIVEHTGYPGEMIELDWDLEADLGIDSIKQAQLFGELREMFDFDIKKLASGHVRSLRQLIAFLEGTGGKGEWLRESSQATPPPSAPLQSLPSATSNAPVASVDLHAQPLERVNLASIATVSPQPTPAIAANLATPSQTADGIDFDRLARFMIDFVVEHTGYPTEVVELDADFEADLGLDSIKLAQLFGELRSHFGLPVSPDNRQAMAKCRTLNDILALYRQQAASVATMVAPVSSDVANDSQATASPEATVPSDSAFAIDEIPDELQNWVQFGRANRNRIRSLLMEMSDVWQDSLDLGSESTATATPSEEIQQRWRSIAVGADVHESNVACLISRHGLPETWPVAAPQDNPLWDSVSEEGTHRYVLRIHPSSVRMDAETRVPWQGAAAIYGNNELADLLEQRLRSEHVRCFRFSPKADAQQLVSELEQFWSEAPVLHLFLTSSFDPSADLHSSFVTGKERGQLGIRNPYWLCQRWLAKVMEVERMNDATLVGATRLGGDFGFQQPSLAPEGGAIAGLLKAIMIESWVNGFRAIPIKIIDSDPQMQLGETLDAIWHELANNSFDLETAWRDGKRHVIRAERVSLTCEQVQPRQILPGENWICTGGGRGITAAVAETLAKQYGVRLHLIGKSRLPQIPASWRHLDEEGTKKLKLEIMQQARAEGKNSLTAWQDMEKVLEVDATLLRLNEMGIEAYYYDCDVTEAESLNHLIAEIRQRFGPIRGCLHGAGVGQDARFERKRPEKVEQCLGAKWDGTLALMQATWNDPLRFFVGFGSISGRFGANGHTDYSAANDGLAKLIGLYRQQRPEVHAVTFHWHAWGDIGMATKPETKLALEMIDMTFMPAAEGMRHLLRELECGAPEREVLITDDRYYRLFFPAETLVREQSATSAEHLNQAKEETCFALLESPPTVDEQGTLWHQCSLDPKREVFLREHCLQSRPLLPVVAGLEMLAEAAIQALHLPAWVDGRQGLLVNQLTALRGLRFFEDQPIEARVSSEKNANGGITTKLVADFHARNGILLEKNRAYLQAEIGSYQGERLLHWPTVDASVIDWRPVRYPDANQIFHVGPSFQVLKKVQLDQSRAFGRIIAPILVELAGAHRKAEGWQIPSAVLDACLFGTGILAWSHVRAGTSLPVGIEKLAIHALPEVGEVLLLETRWKRTDGRFAWFDFQLTGRNDRCILEALEYQICWLEVG